MSFGVESLPTPSFERSGVGMLAYKVKYVLRLISVLFCSAAATFSNAY